MHNNINKYIANKVNEAELLIKEKNLKDAENIYKDIIRYVHTQMINAKKQGKEITNSSRETLRLLEKRLAHLQGAAKNQEKANYILNLIKIHNKLKNADEYVNQGHTIEAEYIYKNIINEIKLWEKLNKKQNNITNQALKLTINIIQEKIYSHRLTLGQDSQSGQPQLSPAELNGRIILSLAVALKGDKNALAGINSYLKSASLELCSTDPLIELADYFFGIGEYQLSLLLYRYILNKGTLLTPQRVELLQKVAAAHEKLDNKREALRSYIEIVKIDRSKKEIEQRIKNLRKEIRLLHWNIATVTEHPRLFFGLSIVIAFFFIAFIPKTQTVNNVDYFTIENHPEMQYYEEFKDIFGNDEFFMIAFEKDDLFTEEGLVTLSEITQELEDGLQQDAEDVKSLANVNDIVGEKEYFEVRAFLDEIPSDPSRLNALKKQAVKNPLYQNSLISKDGKTVSIVIETYEKDDDEDYRKNLILKTEAILDKYRDKLATVNLAGWTITNVRLSEYMNKDVGTFIPITYILITLAIWFVFRNVTLTILAILNISICVGSVMGLYGLTGIKLNNVTSIIPSMVMALALCDTVHIFSHMDQNVLYESGGDRKRALAAVLRLVIVPSFLTSLTTAIGFLSQSVSEIPPIREFAWIASAGMFFEFLFSFFFLPPLLLLFKPEKIYQTYKRHKGLARYLEWNANFVTKHYLLVVIFISLVAIGAFWFMMDIKVENSAIGCFKKSSSLRQSLDFVQERLGGVDSLDISIKANEMDAFKDPENLKVVERIQKHVSTLSGVDHTVSFVDFLKDMNESFHEESPQFYRIPESSNMISQYLLLYSAEDIEDFINTTYDHTRIALRISFDKTSQQAKLINEIRDYINYNIHSENLDIVVTGRAIENVVTIGSLIDGQVYSLAIAAVMVSFVMFLAFRSISIGFLSILPNMFPIILNFGIMGAFLIPLDTGTAIIAAVALGIAVDDTTHFLSEYLKQRSLGLSIPHSIKAVLLLKGRALFSSSLILCIGFSVVILSRFIPTMYFGILTAIIMLTALIGDTFFLPSIIMLRKNKLARDYK